MAISVVDSVARWSASLGQNTAMTSSAFTPANGSLLVLCINWDEGDTSNQVVWTISGGSLTWTTQVERNGNDAGATAGGAAIITAPVGTGASMQVTVTRNTGGGTSSRQMSAKVYVVSGEHATTPIGANGEGSSTTNNLSPTLFTATGAGRAFYCGTDWNQRGLPVSTDTEDGGDYTGAMSCISAYKASDHTSGAISGNLDAGGTSAADWNWVALEILADGGAPAATSFHPEVLSRASRTHFLMR